MSFTYVVSAADWGRITPIVVLAGIALLILMVDLLLTRPRNVGASAQRSGARFNPSRPSPIDRSPILTSDRFFLVLPSLSLLGLGGAFVATIILFVVGDHQPAFYAMIGSDYGSLYAYIIILSANILGTLLSPAYLKRLKLVHQGEYYALMLLATIGMMIMAASISFLTIFLGLEMLSLALYILCGFVARRTSSQEAGMKYFLLSSFASAFLLYGIALTYGATGSTTFSSINTFLSNHVYINHPAILQSATPYSHTFLFIGMGLLIVGFAFKVSAVPFQAWTPDVYQGAPAPVTAFMSVGTKAAALIAFARVFDVALNSAKPDWEPVVWAITILTMIGGNMLALVQSNVKRLLAYSSIAHAGYLLIGVVAGGVIGLSAMLFYLLCYTFLNLGAFGIVSVLEEVDNTGNDLRDIRGLWYRQPVLAGLLAFFMLALAGFPFMAGFAAKFYLFYAALQSGHPELLIIGVLTSILGIYYYLRVIAAMFMEKEALHEVPVPATPAPMAGRGRFIARLVDLSAPAPRAAAVAVKRTTLNQARTVVAVEKAVEKVPMIAWTTWVALIIAAVGTLAMGTLLPFWLVDLAQQAARIMMM